ncbi:Nudix hydrolase 15, mitochondrial [Apophysomyces sp. BC1021]|nr:Nudix hydrolase 15, mitochondrial [Apophysomyces sp. BC1021]
MSPAGSDSIVRVGVACFIKCRFEDGVKILLSKRKGSHGAGCWQVPGGHLEFKESFEECARREVLEETNLELDKIEFVTTTNDIMPADNKHYSTVEIKDIGRLRAMEPEKLEGEWLWVSWNDIQQYKPLFTPIVNFSQQSEEITSILLK